MKILQTMMIAVAVSLLVGSCYTSGKTAKSKSNTEKGLKDFYID